jgi:hypothetical protein
MSDIGNQQIFQLLTEVRDDVKATAATVTKLEVHVEGNGGRGLLQRQEEQEARVHAVEDWKSTRPAVCPATAKEVLKGIGRVVSIGTGIIALLVALSVAGNFFFRDRRYEEIDRALKMLQDAGQNLQKQD